MSEGVGKSAKSDQILVLDPKQELRFKGPFTEVVTSYLKLSNPSERRVCFKVKTTAPKRYCVRPNNGIVEAKSNTQIAVMLQPFDIATETEKNKHKFMVQTMFAPDGEINQDTLWKEASSEAIMDSKLKCVFDYKSEAATDLSARRPDVSAQHVSATPVATQNSTDEGDKLAKSVYSDTKQAPGSPKTSDGQSLSGSAGSSDVRKVQDENRRLREELTHIRQENMQLKEDGLKQRIRHRDQEGSGGSGAGTTAADLLAQQKMSTRGGSGPNAAGQDIAQLLVNPNVLAIGLVLFMIGLIVGKVVF